MKKFTSKIIMAVVMFTTLSMFSGQMRPYILMSARMDGAQQTPSLSVGGTGLASFLLNANRDSLCVNITFSNLSGAPTAMHIHGGGVGVSGPVLLDLSSSINGNRATAVVTGTTLTALLKSNMLKGLTYLNIHTAANPNGEVRGQIIMESDNAWVATIDGAQQTPSLATSAFGLAVFNVSKHAGTVNFYVVTNGLSGSITAAHLHTGAVGVAGPVAQDLGAFISGNTLSGSFTPSAGVITALQGGSIYINVHTAANPGGEIRGQLKWDDKIAFDAWLNGAQQTPSLGVAGKGVASVKVNTTFDTLWYNVAVTGLTGSITSAHFHTGAIGVSGPVSLDISGGISGNKIIGMATGTNIPTSFINSLLSGNQYINVHTAANPGGEIRGQVWRVLREGYTISMDGAQQNPAVTSSAAGSGIVSIDRNFTNAHYMVVTNGATATAVHFHKAKVGVNGPVLLDLTAGFVNGATFGYWKSTDAVPFTLANDAQIDNDSVYVNLHTTTNPGGEIRGQVYKGFKCYATITGIQSLGITEEGVSIYPNPANNNFNVAFTSVSNQKISVVVYDMMGKVISNTESAINVGYNKLYVNLQNATKGLYFVNITNGNEKVTKKLIVE